MENHEKNRRFIAGAQCPKCNIMDGIVITSNRWYCAHCGHGKEMPGDHKTPKAVSSLAEAEQASVVVGQKTKYRVFLATKDDESK